MIQTIEGSILDLNLRETHIKTFDGKDVYIPNGMLLKNPLYNYTIDGLLRQQFSFGFEYEIDLELARNILLETVNKIPGVIQDVKLAKTAIQEAGLYKISVIIQYWIDPTNSAFSGSEIKSQAIINSLSELTKNGIVITGQKINVGEIPNK